jgi:DnaJ-class molecular chaperone
MTGQMIVFTLSQLRMKQMFKFCPICEGSGLGRQHGTDCPHCGGTGLVEKKEEKEHEHADD